MHGDMLIGDEIVSAMLQHAMSVVFHEVSVLDVEVSEHFIGAPETDEGGGLRFNVCIKQGIVTRSTKTLCRDFRS